MFHTISSVVRGGRIAVSTISLVRRYLLTAAYGCNDVWAKRLENPLFSSNRASDLGVILSQKLDRGEPVSTVDIDIYANKIQEVDLTDLWFAEDVFKKFRSTQQSIHQLNSTSHGIIRALLELGELHRLIEMLKDKSTYGIFLDDVSAILTMNQCLEANLPSLAAQVTYELMLQEEDFAKTALLADMSLLSCLQHWLSLRDEGWPEPPVAEEPDENDIEYVVVKYVRNDNYDDHFDITEDRLLLGKTLCSLAPAFRSSPHISNSCRLLGLAMYEKFDLLLEEMTKIVGKAEPVFSDVPKDLLSLLEATPTLPEGYENKSRKRFYLTEDQKQDTLEKVKSMVSNLVVDEASSLKSYCDDHLSLNISKSETNEIDKVNKLYSVFESEREEIFQKEMADAKRRDLHQKAKEQLRNILDREELLTNFENESAVTYAAWLAPRSTKEKKRSRKDEWQTDIDNLAKNKTRSFLDDFE